MITGAMPKILYFAPEDWAFVSHFRPMAQAAQACGLDVVVATRVRRHAQAITREGYKLVALKSQRGRLNPLRLLQSVLEMERIIRRERPTIVHCISLPLAVLGGLAARAARRRHIVLAVTGLGFAWIERGMVPAIVRVAARCIIGFLMRHDGTVGVFENPEDAREFGLAVGSPKVVLVGGAGVDPEAFPCEAEPPAPPVRVAVLARMIKPKGIAEAVAAVLRARELGANVELDLYGAPDPANPTTFSEADLRRWANEPGIAWHGVTNDAALAARMEILRVHGGKPKYYHALIGGNFRIDELQAAVLNVKLPHLDEWTAARQRNAAYYQRAFAHARLDEELRTPPATHGVRHIYNQYVLRVRNRDALRAHLTAAGVGTEIYYPVPLHLQQCFAYLGHKAGEYPLSEQAAAEALALPIYPELSEAQLQYVVDSIVAYYRG